MTRIVEGTGGVEERVLDRIDAETDLLMGLLGDLVRFQTPNPPGGNESEAQQWIRNILEDMGLETDMWDALPGRPNVVGVLKGKSGSQRVILNGHIDVCEDRLLARWSTPPYEPVMKDGAMFGRGTTDMKSGLASFLFAIRTLRAEGIQLDGDVVFQSVIGEERGEPGARSAIERGYTGDFAIVGEASGGRNLIAGVGVINFKVTVESDISLHLVARKLTISAGGGLLGANCAEKMATRVVPGLMELERHWAVFKHHPLIPPSFASINLLRIEGGGNTFILPDSCVAYFTIVYYPNEDLRHVREQVETQIARIAELDPWLRDHRPRVEWSPPEYPVEFAASDFDPTTSAVRELARAIEDVVGDPPRMNMRGAITDAGWFHRAGVPAVVFGPGDVEYVHRIDERVRTVDVVAHCKATTLFLMRFCGVASPPGS